ncbi:MAG: hypothetical protein J7621_21920 [Niastella sp.]|nr:hypothetical protein [Niastella sp.]
MKMIILSGVIVLLAACGKPSTTSIEMITAPGQQDSLFKGLMATTQYRVPETVRDDSLAFLVLPVQASCPACRKKSIDSIMKYQVNLPANHYIIIAANGGRKTIRGYFQEQNYELPIVRIDQQLTLDSQNLAHQYDLYKDKPTLYYSRHQKVYKKVAAIPATVRADLCEFFSGHRPLSE